MDGRGPPTPSPIGCSGQSLEILLHYWWRQRPAGQWAGSLARGIVGNVVRSDTSQNPVPELTEGLIALGNASGSEAEKNPRTRVSFLASPKAFT